MTNIIKEDKSVNADNFAFLLAQSNYNLSTVFRSRNHNETIADTPMCGADELVRSPVTPTEETKTRSHQYQFRILSASTNQLADLKDAEINVVASCYYYNSGFSVTEQDAPRLGNQALLSLFSSIELYIDSTLIERIDFPGMAANADYALRYPHSQEAEKLLESNGFITKLIDIEPTTDLTINTGGVYNYRNSSIVWGKISDQEGQTAKTFLHGVINQRIRLSDIFPCIATLPPIFNHSVTVNFTRNSFNNIICSSSIKSEVTIPLLLHSFIDFKITQDCYIVTDEFKKAAMQYYSKPIETIFTKVKQIPVGFVSEPTRNQTQTFNVCVDSAYKNKLAVFCIPRTTNFNNIIGSKTSRTVPFEDALGKQYDVAQAPSNSYTHGGLKSLTIYTLNGVKLIGFDMGRDAYTQGIFEKHEKMLMLDTKTSPTAGAKMANYQCVYNEYLKAREQFGQIPEEGLDYMTFLKEYCIYCVDLSPFSINQGENLRVECVFDDWASSYNPYHDNNDSEANYSAKQIFTLFYSDKILRLLPNQNTEIADLFQARTEADETNQL